MKHIQRKQPREVIPCTMDFVKALPAGEAINTLDVKVYDPDEVDVSSSIISGTPTKVGTKVSLVVKAGTSGLDYKIEFIIVTTPGAYTLEEEVELQVKET